VLGCAGRQESFAFCRFLVLDVPQYAISLCAPNQGSTAGHLSFSIHGRKRKRALRPGWSFRFLPEPGVSSIPSNRSSRRPKGPVSLGHGGYELSSLFSPSRYSKLLLLEGRTARSSTMPRGPESPCCWQKIQRSAQLRPILLGISGIPRPISPHLSAFLRLFSATWLLQQRLRHAAVLLRESNARVSEVASKLGYSEIYLFSRQFRQMFGASPKKYRRTTSR